MRDLEAIIAKSDVLIEALPYLQRFRGRSFLIKVGGSAMDDEELVGQHMRDIAFLETVGINPIIVHGGGKAISRAMESAGIEAKFIGGFRYTSKDAIDLVSRTLSKEISPSLVGQLREFGGNAVALPGPSVFKGEKITAKDADGNELDLGQVGQVISCNTESILEATRSGIVPVVSPLATEFGTGDQLNVNADLAAAALARELRVAKLVYLSDVPGLLRDIQDPKSIIQSINRQQADDLIADGTIAGGMLPKVRSALNALDAGVRKVHFIDGRIPHTLLLEIFTEQGIGTELIR